MAEIPPGPTADPAAPGPNRWLLLLLAAAAAYVLAVAYVPGFTGRSPLVCMSHRTLGLHCPSCGLTRAIACLVRLDPAAAIRFNPLVVIAAPLVAAFTIDTALAAAGRRRLLLPAVPGPLARWGWILAAAAVVAVALVRTATWLAPEWNPEGWLLPPASFPG